MSQNKVDHKYLFRYTSLPFLLNVLYTKKLSLVDPSRWEDTNDSYLIELYKKRSKKGAVLALCFAQYESKTFKAEKFQHWKIYASNSDGVCIKFTKKMLVERFKSELGDNLRYGKVIYKTINNFEDVKEDLQWRTLPFIKRQAFDDESEYRFIYESDENILTKNVEIDLGSIKEITFNPWIPVSVYETLSKMIQSIDGCKNILLDRSTCLDYERWKLAGDRIIAKSG